MMNHTRKIVALLLLSLASIGCVARGFAPPAAPPSSRIFSKAKHPSFLVASTSSAVAVPRGGAGRLTSTASDDDDSNPLVVLVIDVGEAKTEIAKNWGFILLSGALSVIGGTICTLLPIRATGIAVAGLAYTLAVTGSMGVIGTFVVEKGFRLASLLFGSCNLYLAYRMINDPLLESLSFLTGFIAASTIGAGIYETAFAFANPDIPNRFWNFLSGLTSVAAGGYAVANMPASSLVVPGIALGFSLLSTGVSKIVTGLYGQDEANRIIDGGAPDTTRVVVA